MKPQGTMSGTEFSEPYAIESFLSPSEVEELLSLQSRLPVANAKDFVIEKAFLFEQLESFDLRKKIVEQIGEFDNYWAHLGQFLEPYLIHADTVADHRQVSHKIVLLPLYLTRTGSKATWTTTKSRPPSKMFRWRKDV